MLVTPAGYTDTPMDLFNCYHRVEETVVITPVTRVVDPFMKPVVEAVTRKHPSWVFIASSLGNSLTRDDGTTARAHANFTVFDGSECLGSVWRDWRGRDYAYAIDNKRMSENRQRGRATMTTDAKKAAKIIGQSFYALTPDERLDEANKHAKTFISNIASAQHMAAYRSYSSITHAIRPWIADPANTEAVLAMLGGKHQSLEAVVAAYPDAVAEERRAASMNAKITGNEGYTVWQRGDNYFVRQGAGTIAVFTTGSLRDTIKVQLGLLKLSEVNKPLIGVGVRTGEDTFWVTGEEMAT